MTRKYHHGDLRAALLEAAEAELSETGVENFSLRRVARRAEVSHAAPAHHFGDVGGLLTALSARGFERLMELGDIRQTTAPATARDRILAYGLAYCDFARDHRALFRLCFASDKPDYAVTELQERGDAAFLRLACDVSDLADVTLERTVEGLVETYTVWSMVHGLADLLASGRLQMISALPRPEQDRRISRMLERALPAA